jgi:hypothetical protein
VILPFFLFGMIRLTGYQNVKICNKRRSIISEITYKGLISCEETSKACRNKTRSYTVNTGMWAHLSSESLDKNTSMHRISGENSFSYVKQCISWQFKGKSIRALMGDRIRFWKVNTYKKVSEKSSERIEDISTCKSKCTNMIIHAWYENKRLYLLFVCVNFLQVAHDFSEIFFKMCKWVFWDSLEMHN